MSTLKIATKINNNMKIKDIITESYDITNDALKMPYGCAGSEFDKMYNPEIVKNIETEYNRYKKLGKNPVFIKDQADPDQKRFTTKPEPRAVKSPGYLGREKVLKNAGINKL